MIKTFKWIYKLGVLHERRRIKLLIAQHRTDKPVKPSENATSDKQDRINMDDYYRRLDLWHAVESELDKLTNPQWGNEVQQFAPAPPRIDEDF